MAGLLLTDEERSMLADDISARVAAKVIVRLREANISLPDVLQPSGRSSAPGTKVPLTRQPSRFSSSFAADVDNVIELGVDKPTATTRMTATTSEAGYKPLGDTTELRTTMTRPTRSTRSSIKIANMKKYYTKMEGPQLRADDAYCQRLAKIVLAYTWADTCVAMTVLANAITLGAETNDWALTGIEPNDSRGWFVVNSLFLLIFGLELVLRLLAYRSSFFTMPGRCWNSCELMLLFVQALDLNARYLRINRFNSCIGVLRMLRVFRLIRVARLRTLPVFDDLRVLVSSILSSLPALFWSVGLLMVMIYVFSILILSSVLSTDHMDDNMMKMYFPNVIRTWLTLFEAIVGGVTWDGVVRPLFDDISPLIGFSFCLYVAIALFALMNMLTGVFCDQAMRGFRDDNDATLAKKIAEVFVGPGDKDEDITWHDFEEKLRTPTMDEYFRQMHVDVSEGSVLFDLLDTDGNGHLDREEVVTGCMRLRGNAKALDVATLGRQVTSLQEILDLHTELIYRVLDRDELSQQASPRLTDV